MKKLFIFIGILSCLFAFASAAFADDENPYVRKSGVVAQFGVGYGTIADIDIAPSVGYMFNEHFSLNADILFKFGYEPFFGFEFAVTPKFIVPGKVGSFYLGLGLGYEYYKYDSSSAPYKNIEEDHSFIIKPCTGFNHYFYNGLFWGFNLNLPIYIGKAYFDKDVIYYFRTPGGSVDNVAKNKKTTKFNHGVHFDAYFTIGMKFGN